MCSKGNADKKQEQMDNVSRQMVILRKNQKEILEIKIKEYNKVLSNSIVWQIIKTMLFVNEIKAFQGKPDKLHLKTEEHNWFFHFFEKMNQIFYI